MAPKQPQRRASILFGGSQETLRERADVKAGWGQRTRHYVFQGHTWECLVSAAKAQRSEVVNVIDRLHKKARPRVAN